MNLNEEEVVVRLACPSCQWDGVATLYDIGDGPEWCCPRCDLCFASNSVIGEDGLTGAERSLRQRMAEAEAHRRDRWNSDRRSGIVPGDERSPDPGV